MRSTFSVDDALSSAAVPSRSNQIFIADVLGTELPGVHFADGDDEAPLSSPQTLSAAGPHRAEGSVSEGDLSMREGYVGENHDYAVGHSDCLEYLRRKEPNFLTGSLQPDKEAICSVLRTMADNVQVLPPADEALPWDILNMALWKDSLCELIKEMKTVEEKCPSLLIGNPGSQLYVLTSSPYAAFLTALAAKIADDR